MEGVGHISLGSPAPGRNPVHFHMVIRFDRWTLFRDPNGIFLAWVEILKSGNSRARDTVHYVHLRRYLI